MVHQIFVTCLHFWHFFSPSANARVARPTHDSAQRSARLFLSRKKGVSHRARGVEGGEISDIFDIPPPSTALAIDLFFSPPDIDTERGRIQNVPSKYIKAFILRARKGELL